MQLYLLTRGTVTETKRFIEDLQHVYMPIKTPQRLLDKGYKSKNSLIQLGVRPVMFWEIAFPETQLDYVLDKIGKPANKLSKSKLTLLRKPLKAKKLPDHEFNDAMRLPYSVAKEYIGVRKDAIVNGEEYL